MQHIKRLVLNFPGFETTSSKHQLERLTAGGRKAANLWGFEFKPNEIPHTENAIGTAIEFSSNSTHWESETRYVHFSWADIIGEYENIPYPKSLFLNFPKYLKFFFDGTFFKYIGQSFRYAGFTAYPLILSTLFAITAWILSSLTDLPLFAELALSVFLFLVFCKYPGDLFYTNLSINDWAFARDMCNRTNPDIERRYEEFAKLLAEEVSQGDYDEILIVGHSFGAVWAVGALSYALEKKPELLTGKRVTFFALGSSLLKMALVKSAPHFAKFTKNVVSAKNLLWHEIQTRTDYISFYKAHPFEPMGIKKTETELIVHRINFRCALSETRYKKMQRSKYLAHRQYILYCDVRVHHDFLLRCFGPFFADKLARDPQLINTSPLISKTEKTNSD